jgi:ribosomal protein S18 acetylase RimI-like enzyme
MIVTLRSIIEKNTSESFLTYIKDQMIELYSQLTLCKNVNNSMFIEFVKYNNVFVYIDTKFRIKGTITVLYEKKLIRGGKDVAHIEDFVVDEKFRGLNIGSELLYHVMDEIKQHNVYKIILNCSQNMESFYTKFGFSNKNMEMSYYLI